MRGFLDKLVTGRTGAATMIAAIEAWKNFASAAAQHDDASLLLLDWRGSPPPRELCTTCCPENLCLGREFIEQWATHAGFDDVTIGQIVVACDEAVSNIFRHGYDKNPGPLKFQAELAGDSLLIRILDEAKPVDVSQIKARELSDLRPGGLGTFIMAQVFDEVKYEPQAIGTMLTLQKRLP